LLVRPLDQEAGGKKPLGRRAGSGVGRSQIGTGEEEAKASVLWETSCQTGKMLHLSVG
jgi:hypothetical protein